MKRKFLISLASTALLLTACGGNETQDADNNAEQATNENDLENMDSFKVAVSGTLYPGAYHDEEGLTGYSVEIVRAVADELNLDVEFVELGVDGMLTAAKTGQVDMVAEGVSPNEDQAEDYLVSDPVKYSVASVVVREEDNSGIESLADFEGKKAAGGATTDYMQVAELLGAELVTYDNATNDQYFLDVQSGRTDFIPNDYYIQKISVGFFEDMDVKVNNVFFNPGTSHFAFNKDQVELFEAFNETLAKFREDGTLTEISEEFYGGFDVSIERDEIEGIPVSEIPNLEPDSSEEEVQAAIEKSLELSENANN